MQSARHDISNSPHYIKAKITADKLGLNEVEVKRMLDSEVYCKAVNILFEAGFDTKEKLLPINFMNEKVITVLVYGDELSKAIILLNEFGLSKFYLRVLTDHAFSFDILRVLSCCFKKSITESMLDSKDAVTALVVMGNSMETFLGFQVLFSENLIGVALASIKNFSSSPNSSDEHHAGMLVDMRFYKTASLMQQNGLTNYLKLIANKPFLHYKFYEYLTEKNENRCILDIPEILNDTPSADRFALLCKLMSPEDLKSAHRHDKYSWDLIKSMLENEEDKKALSALIYSPEDLAAKKVLKNIKETIKTTPWSFGLFEVKKRVAYMGNKSIDVPEAVLSQTSILWERSRKLSPTEKLKEVKKLGKEEGQARRDSMSSLKHYVAGKSATAEYFDHFASDEAFERKFGPKL